ncbi:MAG TPA: fused isobutyryl-CoA mutase/GTPase IcmF [Acidimicrobiales bacterium]|nr:fused isobutyryl-CoA mutase/GTPase IcmF [Acidimicrobiales bacterium]
MGDLHVPGRPLRFVTAASLYDGHDAAINIMRRLLQSQGAEVVHLGHNRSVSEVVAAAVQEDADAVAVSSYQGGHNEYFTYLVDQLRHLGADRTLVYGGGGGVITPDEVSVLHAAGVTRIFTPADGQRLGLARMVNEMVRDADRPPAPPPPADAVLAADHAALGRYLSALQDGRAPVELVEAVSRSASGVTAVVGITGTGGAGKSSFTDELVRRFRLDQEDKLKVAVVGVDPTRRRGGGALLGDRIRVNSMDGPHLFYRSMATRGASDGLPEPLDRCVDAFKAAGFDLVIVETPGMGQGDAAIVDHVDVSLYVMTPEFGAPSQLEKIEMLEQADIVVVNKVDRRGGRDAVREVGRQLRRLRGGDPDHTPVYGTVASAFNDDGVTAVYHALRAVLAERTPLRLEACVLSPSPVRISSAVSEALIPPHRAGYLAEVVAAVRQYHRETDRVVAAVGRAAALRLAATETGSAEVETAAAGAEAAVPEETRHALARWPEQVAERSARHRRTLSGTEIPSVALPRFDDQASLVRWLRNENLPGEFPFTAAVFPWRRADEEPTRMFAGEGDPFRTNRRFHFLADAQPATRLSTAFDSVTLYGADPAERLDIYGKIGNSGVSIATLDDMKALFAGFDLTDPATSVSMTINGPAPTILAMFLNTAIDQAVDAETERRGEPLTPTEAEAVAARVLSQVRGTVQADILKEDQGQNTCIFSTEFSLKMMADIQEWFIERKVRNFYSVSISGYHIAEAGANPITQLAFTLANGFTYVEAYLARGMRINDFAPNFSFFFSSGMDPEYSVLGRVARRIWAVAMRDRYGANARAQRLKYHIQTSGRSLHAQEISFNDIRTTLQALCAVYDNANSLHTNAYDEAITTPTEESVRRALAIQLVIAREWGMAVNENPLQGAFIVDELTDLVEEAVLAEMEAISERGGVLGAMETGYQRGRIQDESMLYEMRKHDGSLPIVGVNTFLAPHTVEPPTIPLARSTEDEKESQLRRVAEFKAAHADERPAMLERLADAALAGANVFAVLVDAVRVCTLGEITDALFAVGGRYRRSV